MTEKKFHIPSIIIASAAVILELFSFILEGALVAIVALVLCTLKRKTHRIKIGVALAIFALIFGIGAFFAFMLIVFSFAVVVHQLFATSWIAACQAPLSPLSPGVCSN